MTSPGMYIDGSIVAGYNVGGSPVFTNLNLPVCLLIPRQEFD